MSLLASKQLRHSLHAWAEACDRLVFPRSCLVCGSHSTVVGFCDCCRSEMLRSLPKACVRCASMCPGDAVPQQCGSCARRHLRFEAAVALGPFDETIRDLCLQLKHANRAWLSAPLVDLLLTARREAIEAWMEAARDPVVVPVPLHWMRRFRRGYNQAEALAEVLAKRMGLSVAFALRRVRGTRKLAGLSAKERSVELRGAFALRRHARPVLTGRDVILVDDVLTTGATCSSAAGVIKRAGAKGVLVAVVGRATRPLT